MRHPTETASRSKRPLPESKETSGGIVGRFIHKVRAKASRVLDWLGEEWTPTSWEDKWGTSKW